MLGPRLLASSLLLVPGLLLAQVFGNRADVPQILGSAGLGALLIAGSTLVRRPHLDLGRTLIEKREGMRRLARRFRRRRIAADSGRHRDMIELAPVLALETDAEGRIVHLAGGLRERWKRTEGERRLLRPAHQLVSPEQFSEFSGFLQGLLRGDAPEPLELTLRPDAGCDIPVRATGRAIADRATGRVTGVRAVFSDISREVECATVRHRKLEAGLMAANRRLTDIIDFLPDATMVIDQESRVVAWNRAMEELTGVPKEEMVGQGGYAYAVPFYGERIPVLIDHFGDADLGDWRDLYHVFEANGETICAETFIPFLNGGRGAYLWATASPLFDGDGQIVGAIESLRDITERKRAEVALLRSEEQYRNLNEDLERRVNESTCELRSANGALRESEARFRRIVENLREGHIFYSHDVRGEFSYVSPSFEDVLGYETASEFVGAVRASLERDENTVARRRSLRCRRGRKQSAYDLQVPHRDGSRRIFEVIEVPVFGADGQVESVEGLCRDVTEARRNLQLVREAQEKLVESRKMAALGTLVAGLSHEISTPVGIGVTAISHLSVSTRDCLALYGRDELTRSAFEDFLHASSQTVELLQSNLNRAADLLRNFKQVATDQSSSQVRTFGLDEYLADVIRSFGPRLRNAGITLRRDCDPELELRCDPGALYQIMSNLVMNSLHHGFEGRLVGGIHLSAQRSGDAVELEYRDDGNGMNRQQLARLYEPFFTTKRGRGGTGLGMHIVYNNVTQALGGTISCTSRPGGGTRFLIRLPVPSEVAHA